MKKKIGKRMRKGEEKEIGFFLQTSEKKSPGMIPTLFVSSSLPFSLSLLKSKQEVRDSVIGNLSTVHSYMKRKIGKRMKYGGKDRERKSESEIELNIDSKSDGGDHHRDRIWIPRYQERKGGRKSELCKGRMERVEERK